MVLIFQKIRDVFFILIGFALVFTVYRSDEKKSYQQLDKITRILDRYKA